VEVTNGEESDGDRVELPRWRVRDGGSVQASIGVPVTPENYLPLHKHRHDNMDVVVGVHGLDDAGAG
jgi:hypothetical protein